MKVIRISHFIKNNIAITPTTRLKPIPKKLQVDVAVQTTKNSIRQRLVKKLNLNENFCTYKVQNAQPKKKKKHQRDHILVNGQENISIGMKMKKSSSTDI